MKLNVLGVKLRLGRTRLLYLHCSHKAFELCNV
jgi:hypothetical protein